jgi:hypothetical protein
MRTFIGLCAAVLIAAGCMAHNNNAITRGGDSNGAVPAGANGNGLRSANTPQDPYDQPGALPANSGGTDAGRVGTDPRNQPLR